MQICLKIKAFNQKLNFYHKNLNSDTALNVLNKIKEMYTTKMKAKYPLFKKEEIEKVIEMQLVSYNGKRKFEEEISRYLRKSY